MAKKKASRATAESMASKQREISVSEFFAKNRHLLGFDNPRKALLTTVKEAVDNALDAWAERVLGIDLGLIFTGSIAALVFAYLVRFMAISLNTVDASLGKVTPNMDDAARALGSGRLKTLLRVHAPIMRGSLLTAALIVFVDVMKELPATLIMRPFNFDTLAVQAYRLASDERLSEASTPALMIVAAGLAPVLLLSRSIRKSRPGHPGGAANTKAPH